MWSENNWFPQFSAFATSASAIPTKIQLIRFNWIYFLFISALFRFLYASTSLSNSLWLCKLNFSTDQETEYKNCSHQIKVNRARDLLFFCSIDLHRSSSRILLIFLLRYTERKTCKICLIVMMFCHGIAISQCATIRGKKKTKTGWSKHVLNK